MIYQAHIERIGPHVVDGLAENLLLTFLADGPVDCLDYALALQPTFQNNNAHLLAGDLLSISNETYRITAVGDNALSALLTLGHLSLVFDSATTPRHQGAIHLAGVTPTRLLLHGNLTITEALP